MARPRAVCPVCLRRYTVRADARIPRHSNLAGPPVAPYDDNTCAGSGKMPLPPAVAPGSLVACGGSVHIVLDGEHLVCKSATNDAAESENDADMLWTATASRQPTCPACLHVLGACRAWIRP